MHYRLRTLLIVLALGPIVLAGAWFGSLAVHTYVWPIDRGYNFTRPISDSERNEFNKLIDQVIEAEKNWKADPDFPHLEIIVE
jgi:hypothetical protein